MNSLHPYLTLQPGHPIAITGGGRAQAAVPMVGRVFLNHLSATDGETVQGEKMKNRKTAAEVSLGIPF